MNITKIYHNDNIYLYKNYYEEIKNKIKIFNELNHVNKYNLNEIPYYLDYKDKIKTKKYKLNIFYIFTIHISRSNIMVQIKNKRGECLSFITSGYLKFKGKQKNKKLSLLAILKKIIYNYNIYKNKTIILMFKGLKYNQRLIVKKLKEKFIIDSIIYNNLLPHNGCRPKKFRRK